MIQKVLTKYVLPLHLVVLGIVTFLSCFFPGTGVALSLVWFSLMGMEFLFLLPAVHSGETLLDARSRVLHFLLWDPFVYIVATLLLVTVLQAANSGCKLVYLPDADIWQMSDPAVEGLPFAVEVRAVYAVLFLFLACSVSGIVLRAGTGHGGKRLVFDAFSICTGLLGSGLTTFCLLSSDAGKTISATGGAPLGAVFMLWSLMGIGALSDFFLHYGSDGKKTVMFFLMVGIAGNVMASMLYLDAFWVFISLLLDLLMIFYGLFAIGKRANAKSMMKFLSFCILFVTLIVSVFVFLCPENPVSQKMTFLFSMEYEKAWSDWSAMRAIRTDAALTIWQEHPWWGVGTQGFRHFVGLVLDTKSWGLLKVNPGGVGNDYLQFLCEYGIVGMGLMVAAAFSLMVSIGYRCRVFFQKSSQPIQHRDRYSLLDVNPFVVSGMVVLLLTCVHAWLGNPFRSPVFLLSWVVVLSALPDFLPAHKE